MSAVAFAERCTQAQRDYIRTLLERCELPDGRFTFQHRVLWRGAGLAEPQFDGNIDAALRDLTKPQASRLIGVLEQRAGIEREEDED